MWIFRVELREEVIAANDNTHPAVANGLVIVSSVKRRKIGRKFEMRGGDPAFVQHLTVLLFTYIYGEKITRTFLFLQPHALLQHTRFL